MQPTDVSLLAQRAKYEPMLMEELWEAVRRLIALWAYRYVHRGSEMGTRIFDADDLKQAGYLALVDAVKRFDPECDYAFTTLLHFSVRRQFAIVAGRGASGQNQCSALYADSLDEPIAGETDLTRAEMLADPNAEFADGIIDREAASQDCAALLTEIDKLPERQRQALMLMEYHGWPPSKVADVLGVNSRQRADQIRNDAIRNLRKMPTVRRIAQERFPMRRHVGLTEFRSTWISTVEWSILRAEELRERRCDLAVGNLAGTRW